MALKKKDLENKYRNSAIVKRDFDTSKILTDINSGLMPTLGKIVEDIANFDKSVTAAMQEAQAKIVEFREAKGGDVIVKLDETKSVKKIVDSIKESNANIMIGLNRSTEALQKIVIELVKIKREPIPVSQPSEVTVMDNRPLRWEFDVERTQYGYKITAEAG